MAFLIYDIILLVLFVVFISLFLYFKKDNLKREGLFFLYRTSWGIRLINIVGKKYKKTLKVLSYFSIALGYILMVGMVYLFGKIVWIYAFDSAIVQAIKIPPIVPLFPYIDQIVPGIGLPTFYFTYWIIILAVIAITHEFSHGIFAAYNKIKIKKTGFGFFPFFLPIFPLAFVELDEKKMAKKSRVSQLAILSAGTFANVLTTVFFLAVLWIFFSFAFAPAGVIYDTYSYSPVNISDISMINGILMNISSYDNMVNATNETGLNRLKTLDNRSYLITKDGLENQKENPGYIIVYDDAPAINAELDAIILEINGQKVTDIKSFREELGKYSPGEKIILTTRGNETEEKEIVLGKNPLNESLPFLGIAFLDQDSGRISGKLISVFSSFKKSHVYYESEFDGISLFVYNLLWWLILISISVALVNMLPMGIFDGGRFFYLTVLGITKNEKIAKKAFSLMSFFLFFLVLLVILFWVLQSFF